jgi:AraC family transcriptional regulator
VASRVGVHPFHLSRVFRQHYHQTVGEYVHRLRVHFACGELKSDEARLAEVALAAGFADQSHFTRVFKQVTGMTPGAFRDVLKRD